MAPQHIACEIVELVVVDERALLCTSNDQSEHTRSSCRISQKMLGLPLSPDTAELAIADLLQ